jgi:ribosomal-protein-alanine N-acetyltransferase
VSTLTALLQLRAATVEDAPRLARLAEQVGGSWNVARYTGSLAGSGAGWLLEAASPASSLPDPLAALLRPAVAAAAVVQPAADDWELLDLAVAPPCQRQGLARTLLAAVVAAAGAAGATRLLLEVRAGNARAHAIYAAAGFVRIACRRAYYPATRSAAAEDAIVMALAL